MAAFHIKSRPQTHRFAKPAAVAGALERIALAFGERVAYPRRFATGDAIQNLKEEIGTLAPFTLANGQKFGSFS